VTRNQGLVHHQEQHRLYAHQWWEQSNTTMITTPAQPPQQQTTRLTLRPGPPTMWTSQGESGSSLSHLRPSEARSTDGEMFKTKKPAAKSSGSTGTIARSRRHPQAQQHPYSSSAFREEGNRWMGGSVGCSVFEEHHRIRTENESETRTMNQMAQREHNLNQQENKDTKGHQTPLPLTCIYLEYQGPYGAPKKNSSVTTMRGLSTMGAHHLVSACFSWKFLV